MSASLVLTSAKGVLSLLKEPDEQLRVHALQQLNNLVDHHWVEIVGDVTEMYAFYCYMPSNKHAHDHIFRFAPVNLSRTTNSFAIATWRHWSLQR